MVHRTYIGFITDISLMSMKSSSFLSFKSLGVSISFTEDYLSAMQDIDKTW
jgi:hypothetical protein